MNVHRPTNNVRVSFALVWPLFCSSNHKILNQYSCLTTIKIESRQLFKIKILRNITFEFLLKIGDSSTNDSTFIIRVSVYSSAFNIIFNCISPIQSSICDICPHNMSRISNSPSRIRYQAQLQCINNLIDIQWEILWRANVKALKRHWSFIKKN